MPRNRPRRRLLRGLKALTRMVFPTNNAGWGSNWLPGTTVNYQRQVGDGTASAVVMAPLGWLMRNSSAAPIRIREYDDDENLTPITPSATDEGPGRLLRLLNQPNPAYSGRTLRKATVLSLELDANAYWLKVRNDLGAVVQLWWVPHTMMEPKREDGSENLVDYYDYSPDGTPRRVEAADVVHFRDGLDPENPAKGLNSFRCLLRELYTDNEAANFSATLLRNLGVPGLVVSPETDSDGQFVGSDEDVKETKRKVRQATTGENRGDPLVFTQPTRLQTYGFNPQQMDLRSLRRLPEERATAIIGVPAIVAGLGAGLDRSTFANFAEAREVAYEEKVIPGHEDQAETIAHQLLPDFTAQPDRYVIDFDLSKVRVLQEDEDKKADREVRLVQAGVKEIAEAREALGLEVDDSHRVFLRPMSFIEVPAGQTMAEALPDVEAGTAATPEDAEAKRKAGRVLSARNAATIRAALDALKNVLDAAGITDDPDDDVGGKARYVVAAAEAEVKRLSRAQQARLIQALDADARQLQAAFEKRLTVVFTKLGKHVADTWAAEAAKGATGGDTKADGDDALTPHDIAVALRAIDIADVPKWQGENLTPEYARHYDQVARRTLETLTAQLGIEVKRPDDVAVTVLQQHGRQAGLVDLDSQTKQALFQALAHAKHNGDGVPAMERRIRQYVTDGSAGSRVSARATRIARTETMHAQRVSTRTAYEVSGAYDAVVAWDDRLGYGDDDCMARNGEVFTFEQAESEELEEHPNGTLSWAPTSVREG